MAIECDPSQFHKNNVVDSCSISNLLSSLLLFERAKSINCHFLCVYFVYYEFLYKPRKKKTSESEDLQQRFKEARKNGQFKDYHLELEDLQEIEILERRKKLGKGELASIAYAKKINQAFLTDDQKARKLASTVLSNHLVQTTPHLLGWLFFESLLSDGELEPIIEEHNRYNRPLEPHFIKMYERALDYRSKQYFNANSD